MPTTRITRQAEAEIAAHGPLTPKDRTCRKCGGYDEYVCKMDGRAVFYCADCTEERK